MNSHDADKFEVCDIIRNADIWLDNDNIDGYKVSALLGKILQVGDFDKFEFMFTQLLSAKFGYKIQHRLAQLDGQRKDIIKTIQAADEDINLSRVILKPFETKKIEIDSLDDLFSREPGLYFRNNNGEQYSTFDNDFAFCNDELKTLFRERGFARTIAQHSLEQFRIIDGARIHAFNHHFYAISDKDGYYDSFNSARLAKVSHVNFLDNNKEVIDKAVILPIEHGCNNYYHHLGECMAGLKFISELPSDIPIIYTENKFGALDFIASRLCIDRSRFIPMKALSKTIVRKALHLSPCNFMWDQDIYSFFKMVSYPQTAPSKIYVSRRKSSRGPSNELEVENELRALGFEILFPEELSFAQQVFVFSNASFLIGPHGAGLTNICLLYTSPSPRDGLLSRMPSSA